MKTARKKNNIRSVGKNGLDLPVCHAEPTAPDAIFDDIFLGWPSIDSIGLSSDCLIDRLSGIGGSDANVIFSGDPHRITRLWQEKRGEVPLEDLSNVLPVQLGLWTESFNRQWFERITGQRVISAGTLISCSDHQWRRCTLDGVLEATGAIFEAKHTNGFAKPDEVLERYMPQLQHNMAVAKTDRAFLSVIFGNHKFEMFEVGADWLYQLDLFEAELKFWDCVISGRPPEVPSVPSAPKPIGTREVCFEGNNAWGSAAVDWLRHREAAKTHSAATGLLKSLIEEDVVRAFGHGIEAKRSKSGAVTIRELT